MVSVSAPLSESQLKPTDSYAAPLIKALVIDDELDIAQVLGRLLKSCGNFEVSIRTGRFDISRELPQLDPDVIFLDLVMPDFDGFDVLTQIKNVLPDVAIVVESAYSTVENTVRAIKLGAFDFLPKPFDHESVQVITAKIEHDVVQRAQCNALKQSLLQQDSYLRSIIGRSAAVERLHHWILRVRHASANVLIEGESGTGKELVARAVHAGQGPFIAVNMAAIPDDLADSELFGHQRGAFTGATQDRKGLLSEANGGTLLLDEVNSMSPLIQAKLLRVIQDRRIRPVGADQEQEVNFRLISATNQNLEAMVREGLFRRDLYHRLRVLNVTLPPLRDRIEDIPILADQFLQYYSRAHGKRVRNMRADALHLLQQMDWPGNVRELENLIEAAVILCDEDTLEVTAPLLNRIALGGSASDSDEDSDSLMLADAERKHIRLVMEIANGNKAQAARLLAIDYKTLLRKLNG